MRVFGKIWVRGVVAVLLVSPIAWFAIQIPLRLPNLE